MTRGRSERRPRANRRRAGAPPGRTSTPSSTAPTTPGVRLPQARHRHVQRAARELEGVVIECGAMIGDSAIDIEAGRRLGLTTIRLGASDPDDPAPDHEVPTLLEAVRRLTAR